MQLSEVMRVKEEDYRKILSDMHMLYEKGRLRMFFCGPYLRGSSLAEDERLLMRKHKLSRRKVIRIIKGTMMLFHFVLSEETEEILPRMSGEDRKSFKKRVALVSEVLKKDPSIQNSYYTYSLSKGNHFAGIDWEADMRVFHSPQEYIIKPPSVPVGRIRIALLDPNESPPKDSAIQFEIGLKDISLMISYLEDLRRAVKNLETAKIVPKGVS